jgi:MFS family permease
MELLLPFRLFMLSLCQPHHYYQHFLSQGVGQGLGMGLMFLPCLTVTSHYFRRRRSFVMGIVISGISDIL